MNYKYVRLVITIITGELIRRTRIESVIGNVVLNNDLKVPSFRDTKNFFVKTALVCMLQHAKAIAETLDYIKNQTSAA